MKVDLYTFVTLYSQQLDTLGSILAKGADHASAIGASEAEMLEWRLVEDMFPLRRQVQIVCDFASRWPARAAGLPLPEPLEGDSSLSELQAAIAEARSYLQQLTPEQFEGRDDVELTVNIGVMEPTLAIGRWVTGFATTNLYFHLSIAYAILRAKGVPLGKRDLFPGGL